MDDVRIQMASGWEDKVLKMSDATVAKLCEAIAEDARRLAPVKTGHLRSSIRAEKDRVVADADYSGAVEMGTEHQRAQPYLRPAAYRKRSG
ncbi:HK97-gp10 family putative phage morphogenesis protein [Streptomyces sp. NPDC001599]|uniref:HK97-gp10 family putative phage morphogenesis protein n=1 Tax=Streptomyces sp. NPDC001599 TaxID=3364591 RepID=UPI00367BF668